MFFSIARPDHILANQVAVKKDCPPGFFLYLLRKSNYKETPVPPQRKMRNNLFPHHSRRTLSQQPPPKMKRRKWLPYHSKPSSPLIRK